MQLELIKNPRLGSPIPGSGGARKLRVADPRRGKGKRGGLRVIYYLIEAKSQILFGMIYHKSETSGLAPNQLAALRKFLDPLS